MIHVMGLFLSFWAGENEKRKRTGYLKKKWWGGKGRGVENSRRGRRGRVPVPLRRSRACQAGFTGGRREHRQNNVRGFSEEKKTGKRRGKSGKRTHRQRCRSYSKSAESPKGRVRGVKLHSMLSKSLDRKLGRGQ